MNRFDLNGRVALITGAGQGVGRQVALDFAANGAGTVIVNDVNAERAEKVVAEVQAAGGQAVPMIADVTDFQQVTAAVDSVVAHTGPITILINNAGNAGVDTKRAESRNFWETSPETWEGWIKVNLYGVLYMMRAVLPQMVAAGQGGNIVTVVSDAGRTGDADLVPYSAAKAGAAGLTRSVARALGRHGIVANNVSLGSTRTPTTQRALADEEMNRKLFSNYVIRRPGDPEDVVGAILLLASSASSWTTGQTYAVNGGFSFSQ
ncbi:SDR family NAD(P)-dependent oxidoreductase [Nocardia vaccinii]|uniref:SDR family NAD(P)-dependent oxidoreductase n=1 Tax=Nocardia vaccinii TaxID=1822 RepID=UPI00083310FA|nr:SDR family oxidoreductase [Nocardia vaccinii]